ncbi:MAG TPA: DUF4276 family protein, partial [Planctomycetota bacterium]|nr:DUF4276 family protein [Planctomycetota bacterium]
IHPHNGKRDLLAKLPNRLAGYAPWLPDDWRIVVLIDEDRQACRELKKALERAARRAKLVTWSAKKSPLARVLNRLAVEELEAWFFGDVDALRSAFPRVPPTLARRATFRDPDAIRGGTCQALERVLKGLGYYPGGLLKTDAARRISEHVDPERNRSKSFRVFRDALRQITTMST